MQYTVTINIPETLESHIKNIDDFDAFVRVITIEALQHQDAQEKNRQLAEAAQLMLQDYLHDEELTSFTALDGEPVYE